MSEPIIALCAVQDVKNAGGFETHDRDDRIKALIPQVLRRFQIRLGREFMPRVTATRTFGLTNRLVQLLNSDLVSATAVVLHPEYEAITLAAGIQYDVDVDPLTGTAGLLEIAGTVSLQSRRALNFGAARIAVTGDWGIWESLEDVPPDVREAAALTVLAALETPTTDLPAIGIQSPRDFQPARGAGWDIPIDAWRKMQDYNRNLGA